jgi:hypothetical protein
MGNSTVGIGVDMSSGKIALDTRNFFANTFVIKFDQDKLL